MVNLAIEPPAPIGDEEEDAACPVDEQLAQLFALKKTSPPRPQPTPQPG
jgi:hypothetical protein